MTIQRQAILWEHITEQDFYKHIDPDSDFTFYDNEILGWATYVYGSEALITKCEDELPLRLKDIASAIVGYHSDVYDDYTGIRYFPLFFKNLSHDEKMQVEEILHDIRSEVEI